MQIDVDKSLQRLRRPVRRADAEYYLLFMLLSFAASIVVTRIFLELTGFPQLGNSQLHIAHVLWGGLLLFIALLLPLIFANRWTYPISAVLGGVGVGLFIDEVGKFITQNNNYFFPAAAPIIYAFFLLTVIIYLQVKREANQTDSRSDLYRAFDQLTEVIDQDLDAHEREEIQTRLRRVSSQSTYPDQARLAGVLLDFLSSTELHIVPHR
jgi:hypothetical protein